MEKKYKRGLVLGKFMPVHNGHLHLINEARKECEKVYVMVCSIESEPIDGRLRFNWVRNIFILDEDVEVIHCEDENPQYDHECASKSEFYAYWTKSVYDRIDELDAVFTSEDYGDDFAEYLEVEHVLVDKERKTYPVSATMIRENPYDHWGHIPMEVRPYFTKKVCLVGPESVGKSTLSEKLAKYFNTNYVEEYGRYYTENKVPTGELDIMDFGVIATNQLTNIAESDKDPKANQVVFIDTDCITTYMFSKIYLDNIPEDEITEIFQHYIDVQKHLIDFYILLDVDVPWVQDGTRELESVRQEHFHNLKEELDKQEVPYIVISGDYSERFEKSVEKVKELLG